VTGPTPRQPSDTTSARCDNATSLWRYSRCSLIPATSNDAQCLLSTLTILGARSVLAARWQVLTYHSPLYLPVLLADAVQSATKIRYVKLSKSETEMTSVKHRHNSDRS
jgi:hypothetical protein